MSEEEKRNVFKINVPIFTNEELERLDYTIENYLDSIVNQISETVSRDRDIIILKKVIETQQKEIKELKDKYSDEKIRDTVIKRYREVIEKDYISKDKIRERMKQLEEFIQVIEEFKRVKRSIRELVHEMNKFEDEFISKEKVKDKIKEVESYLDNAKENGSIKEYELVIEFLEELLEE